VLSSVTIIKKKTASYPDTLKLFLITSMSSSSITALGNEKAGIFYNSTAGTYIMISITIDTL
jgi:hypothetical protein